MIIQRLLRRLNGKNENKNSCYEFLFSHQFAKQTGYRHESFVNTNLLWTGRVCKANGLLFCLCTILLSFYGLF